MSSSLLGGLWTFMRHVLEEPLCDVVVPWELPVPTWFLGLLVLYEINRRRITTIPELVWIVTQLIIVSRMELLVMATLLPFLIGRHATWCQTPEYLFGVMLLLVRFAYITLNVVSQVNTLSPQCVARLKELIRP